MWKDRLIPVRIIASSIVNDNLSSSPSTSPTITIHHHHHQEWCWEEHKCGWIAWLQLEWLSAAHPHGSTNHPIRKVWVKVLKIRMRKKHLFFDKKTINPIDKGMLTHYHYFDRSRRWIQSEPQPGCTFHNIVQKYFPCRLKSVLSGHSGCTNISRD